MSLNPGDRVAGLGDLSHPMEAEPGAARARPDPKQAMSKMARTLSELSLERRQLLGRLMQLEGLDPRNLPIAPRGKDSGDLPLSFAQQRLWFLDQLEPGSPRYNIPSAFQIAGTLDLGALERALHEIARRHEILRTTFPALDGKPVQVTAPQCSLGISVVDLEALPETEKQARLRALREREALTPFDLSEGPLVRAAVVRLGNHLHQLLLTMHHIVSDGWSGGIFHRELSILYDAFLTGRQSPLPELPVQYADFARWQRELLQGEVLESLLTYWRARLVDAPLVLELPTDRPRPAVQSFRGAMQFFTIPASLSEALRAFGRREDATLFMVLLAGFLTMLNRYTDCTDLVVGTTIANRNRAEIEGLIGFFVNNLVLRVDLAGDPSFTETVRRVREVTLGAYAHQDLPFEKLVEELQPQRDLSHNPLFQVMFDLQNIPTIESPVAGTDTDMAPDILFGTAKFDLALSMRETATGLTGVFEYNTDLFDHATITRMVHHLRSALTAVIHPERTVSSLDLLSISERRQLSEWNATRADYPDNHCVHALLEEQAQRTPSETAVELDDEKLSYEELDRRANQLARHLRELGVGVETRVGLYVEPSLQAVIGVLGVLKAGGTYVPLDPDYPRERLRYMVDDAGITVLLTAGQVLGELRSDAIQVVHLDTDWLEIGCQPDSVSAPLPGPDNVACIFYTSGSTGRPKGTLTLHRGLCNVVAAQRRTFGISVGDRVLQYASLSFDASTFELLMALAAGATLCVVRRTSVAPGPQLLELLRRTRINVVTLPPSALNALPVDGLPDLHTIMVAGEACPTELVRRWSRRRRFFNLYGPTETAIWATTAECTDAPGAPVIGVPISNVEIHLLDRRMRQVPIGVPGEIYIGGVGLARGYLGQPALTAERFVPNPFSSISGSRLYKTGDRARFQPGGALGFLGRIDEQVKLRGYRIEPGEVEAALLRHPNVARALVMARRRADGDEVRLVAYLAPADGPCPPVDELRLFLGRTLPGYMIPSHFVALDVWPVSPNGKTDREALPEPEKKRPDLGSAFVAPCNPTEEKLAAIWATLLGVERLGVHDSFFDLGGHSLLATQLVSRVRDEFAVDFSLDRLFSAPTIAELAAFIADAPTGERRPGEMISTQQDTGDLLRRIDDLSDDEVDSLLVRMSEDREPRAAGSETRTGPEAPTSDRLGYAPGRDWSRVLQRPDELDDKEVDELLAELLAAEEGSG